MSLTNPTWIGLGSKPGLRYESPEDNHVNHGTTENLLFKIICEKTLNKIREMRFYMLCIMILYGLKELDEAWQHATFLSMLFFKTVRNCECDGFHCTHIDTNL